MQKQKKVILIVVALFVALLVFGWLYWYFLSPGRSLGEEGDARYYSNYMAAKLTGREVSNVKSLCFGSVALVTKLLTASQFYLLMGKRVSFKINQ